MSLDIEKFVAGLHDYLSKAFTPLVQRIVALEQLPVKTLADAYKGAHLPGQYKRGDLVTRGGSLWIAVEDANGTPGSSPSWRLIVQRGRDGKDAAA
jgi:hypothetical protein